jgi:oligoribonuclease
VTRSYDHILVLDLETTGTDERFDLILETAGILVSADTLVEVDRWNTLHRITTEALRTLDPYVHTMHTKNGLLDDLAKSTDFGTDASADSAWTAWLKDVTRSSKHVALSGSGVAHFDSRFLRLKMPHFTKALTYFTLDVGVVRRIATDLATVDPTILPDQNKKTHRAMDDAEFHLEELRFWVSVMKGLPQVDRRPNET